MAKPSCGSFRRQFVTADHHEAKRCPNCDRRHGSGRMSGSMIRMLHSSCDRRCPKFVCVGGPFLAVCPLPRAPDPHDKSETYVCSSERGSMSCLHIGHLTKDAVAVGQQWPAAAGLRMQPWPPFFGRLGKIQEHDSKARTRGQKRSCDGRRIVASHPGISVVPRVPRHIRMSGPGLHQLSVIGCAMVTA